MIRGPIIENITSMEIITDTEWELLQNSQDIVVYWFIEVAYCRVHVMA